MGTLTRRVMPAVLKALREYVDTQDAAEASTRSSADSTLTASITALGALSGEIKMWGGSGTPTGYLLCDGSSVLRATYPALFSAIGTTYGSVDGTHFTLPNFANLFPRGNTQGPGGGADTHTHTSAAHSHTLSDAGQAQLSHAGGTNQINMRQISSTAWNQTDQVVGSSNSTPTNSRSAGVALQGATDSATPGSTGSANNIPAYTGVAFIIKT